MVVKAQVRICLRRSSKTHDMIAQLSTGWKSLYSERQRLRLEQPQGLNWASVSRFIACASWLRFLRLRRQSMTTPALAGPSICAQVSPRDDRRRRRGGSGGRRKVMGIATGSRPEADPGACEGSSFVALGSALRVRWKLRGAVTQSGRAPELGPEA